MGIKVEFNPDLALRNITEFKKGRRKKEECLPENIKKGKIYNFLKKEQRIYCLTEEVPLVETQGQQILSRPRASVIILEAVHFIDKGEVWTRGKYKIKDVFNDDKIHFEGCSRIKFKNNK